MSATKETIRCGYQVIYGKEPPCCYWKWVAVLDLVRRHKENGTSLDDKRSPTLCIKGDMGRICEGLED